VVTGWGIPLSKSGRLSCAEAGKATINAKMIMSMGIRLGSINADV
jgi:hypothetical protein